MVLHLKEQPYLCLASGSSICSQNRWLFAVSSSKVPLTKYIAVTKRICDELSKNTVGKDCTEIYQKTKEVLQHFKERRGPLTTPPKRNGRPSKPSGKTPPMWF